MIFRSPPQKRLTGFGPTVLRTGQFFATQELALVLSNDATIATSASPETCSLSLRRRIIVSLKRLIILVSVGAYVEAGLDCAKSISKPSCVERCGLGTRAMRKNAWYRMSIIGNVDTSILSRLFYALTKALC